MMRFPFVEDANPKRVAIAGDRDLTDLRDRPLFSVLNRPRPDEILERAVGHGRHIRYS